MKNSWDKFSDSTYLSRDNILYIVDEMKTQFFLNFYLKREKQKKNINKKRS